MLSRASTVSIGSRRASRPRRAAGRARAAGASCRRRSRRAREQARPCRRRSVAQAAAVLHRRPSMRNGSAARSGSPAAASRRLGGRPVDGLELAAARPVEPRHRAQQAHRVGMARAVEHVVGGALLDDARRIHHVDAVGVARDHAEIVRDDDQRDVELARQILHQLEDLRLDGDVERGGRLVGDDELRIAGEPDRDHHALAHAAGELVRILLEPALGVGDADQLQQLERARARAGLVMPRWMNSGSMICSPIVRTGLSEVIGSWKIIEMSRPRTSRISSSESSSRLRPSNRMRPEGRGGVCAARPGRGGGGDRLAAAGFADDGDDLAAVDV